MSFYTERNNFETIGVDKSLIKRLTCVVRLICGIYQGDQQLNWLICVIEAISLNQLISVINLSRSISDQLICSIEAIKVLRRSITALHD